MSHRVALSWLAAPCLLLAAATSSAVAATTLKFGTVAPDNTPWSDELKAIQKRVSGESAGSLEIKLYLGGQLGGELEILQGVRRGRIQGGGFSTGALASAIPELDVLEIPFIFENNDEADFILDHYLFEPFQKLFEQKGLVLVTWAENGWRDIATRTKPVLTPADLKGLKIRSQESKAHLGYWKKIGANPVPLAITEVLSSLQTGLIEGFDNTPLFTLAAELNTGIKHYSVTRHIYQPGAIVFSKTTWDKLSESQRKTLMGPGNAMAPGSRKAVRALSDQLLSILKDSGVKVVELAPKERLAFKTAVAGYEQEIVPQLGGDSRRIYELVQEGKKDYASRKKK
jgi:tripartite ATP-independent transporter DctP family solute receptor